MSEGVMSRLDERISDVVGNLLQELENHGCSEMGFSVETKKNLCHCILKVEGTKPSGDKLKVIKVVSKQACLYSNLDAMALQCEEMLQELESFRPLPERGVD